MGVSRALHRRARPWRVPRPWAAGLLVCVLMPCALSAQVVPRPPAAPAAPVLPPRVLPGDASLRPLPSLHDSVRYTLTMYRDADEIPVGRLTELWRTDSASGTPLVLRVQRLQRNTMQLIDSTWTDARTLAPRARRSLQQSRRVLLEFNGARVKGSLAPLDAPPVPVDTTLRLAPFDAGNWELVLRALPLATGYAARLPVYDLDGGLREYLVQVTGQTTMQEEAAHVVVLTLARNRESVVWVSVHSGQVLQIETMLGETTMLRQVRVRP